jgi:hypothetical protein
VFGVIFLNAEGAKVSQRTQKRKYKKKTKMKALGTNRFYKSRFLSFFFFYFFCLLFVFFCALCETFAPSAFKKSPY